MEPLALDEPLETHTPDLITTKPDGAADEAEDDANPGKSIADIKK